MSRWNWIKISLTHQFGGENKQHKGQQVVWNGRGNIGRGGCFLCEAWRESRWETCSTRGGRALSLYTLALFPRSVSKSCPTPLPAYGLQHSRLSCPSPLPRVCSDSCPLSQWCHPTISSAITSFSPCPQSFPASECFSSESTLCIRWPKDIKEGRKKKK